MKKTILFMAIIAIAISVSACTTTSQPAVEENNKINTPLDQTKTTEPVKTDPVNTTIEEANKEVTKTTMTNEVLSPDKQPQLIGEYSGAIIKTNMGDIKVKLYNTDSPVTVNNFLHLAQAGFYNNTKFHRIIKDFMIQAGDPNSREGDTSTWGMGGPDYRFADEFNAHKLVVGSLAMANAGPGTNGSQFFIVTLEATPWLDGKHTNFGEVVEGMDIVMKIEGVATAAQDRPVKPVIITAIELIK